MLTLFNPMFDFSNPLQKLMNAIRLPDGEDLRSGATIAAGGMAAKVGRGMVGGPLLAQLSKTRFFAGLDPKMQAAIGAILGGFAGVAVTRFVGEFLEDKTTSRQLESGAWLIALMPLLNWVIGQATFIPGNWRAAALAGPNRYFEPSGMGAEYQTQTRALGGFAPGDFGDNASPTYPMLAGDAPNFDLPNQYENARLGVFMEH